MTKGDRRRILVVDDEPGVRSLIRAILVAQGYDVLEAGDAASARTMAGDRAGDIDLLLTDMVMPGASGTTLARQLCDVRPDLKVLFISGFADPTLFGADKLDTGSHFLQKPFKPSALAAKVREVLGAT